MQTTELGHTGTQISRLALGAMQMGNATGEPDSIHILNRYLEVGGSFIDTADCYEWWATPGSRGGESEELLGRWLRAGNHRDEVFLATKGSALPVHSPDLWAADGTANWDLARRTFAGAGATVLRDALDGSLRRLGTDHVDLYYIHVDDRVTPLEETLETLAGFVRAGKVRHLGWSNVYTWRLERIRQLCKRHGWPLPVAVQQQHSYLRPNGSYLSVSNAEQLDYLAEHDDQTLVAYSPILKGIYDDPAKRAGHSAMSAYAGADSDARLAALTSLAGDLGVTPNQLVLAWMMHQDAPTAIPLIGPRTIEQFEAAVPALDLKLTPDQLDLLS
ncbi:aldo/keto reductase [Winogradskya humida]|uniref:Aldo/keto reductase n=1 Tax=Winogradskya humida TaxID=113566 RepID=A0ABQ3ZYR6_9ACTN|nr:aldo/keto reductase [Actinoplanes humidus]GIE23741.1 aldo/keto reductase [Actinoplanes humidus]